MPNYRGHRVVVRLGTSEAHAGTVTAVPYVTNISWDKEDSLEAVGKGIGQARNTEVHEGPIYYTGAISRRYDNTAIGDMGTTLANFVQAYGTAALTQFYVSIQIDAVREVNWKKCKAKYSAEESEEGFMSETIDVKFEEISDEAL